MPLTDLPLDQLQNVRYEGAEPPELEQWWRGVLDASRASARPPVFEPYRHDLYRDVRAYDVTYSGFGGHPVKAWFLAPASGEPAPCVVRFIGYGSGRGVPAEHLFLASQGIASF